MDKNPSTLSGILITSSAFVLWGFFPLYFTLIDSVSVYEVLSWRIIGSVIILFFLLSIFSKVKSTISYFKNKEIIIRLFIASFLMSLNWIVFIYAVNINKILEVSIGYYSSPIVSIALGFIFLKERLNIYQSIAVALGVVAIIYQWISLGYLPLISIVLAFSFSCYALIKKHINISSISSLFIETLMLSPIAICFLIYFYTQNDSVLTNRSLDIWLLLSIAGIITIAPLLLFGKGVKIIPLYITGFLQYITPSINFLLAIFFYNQEVNIDILITFILVWIALVIIAVNSVRSFSKKQG